MPSVVNGRCPARARRCRLPTSSSGGGKLTRPGQVRRGVWIGLGCIWAGVLALHVALRLPDIGLWIGFPALFVPWILFGPSSWFDR
jgi:hypothetical protein